MTPLHALLLVGGGLAAGIVNAMAGGGSLLTVPLLVLAGLPGGVANGSNRVGVLASNTGATISFRRGGVDSLRDAVPVLVPVVIGSVVGATLISQLADKSFERLFGFVMLPLLVLALKRPKVAPGGEAKRWPPWLSFVVFLAIGLYGGAFQAGVGLILVLAIARSGIDLVKANSIKVIVIWVFTAFALPVFVLEGKVRWAAALFLAAGFAAGGATGAHLAVKGGDKIIRPVLALSVVALAGHMIHLY